MTVQQLIDRLQEFPPDMEVKARETAWDAIPYWDIDGVELSDGVAVIDVVSVVNKD